MTETLLEPKFLNQEGLNQPEITKLDASKGLVFSLEDMSKFDPNGLVARVNMAGEETINLYYFPKQESQSATLLAINSKDVNSLFADSEDDNDNVKKQFITLHPGQETTLGRNQESSRILGLSDNRAISRSHVELSYDNDGKLRIKDLESTNGTEVEFADYSPEIQEESEARHEERVGSVALGHEVVKNHEFKIGNVSYKAVGYFHTDRPYLKMQSVDEKGEKRSFLVYKSNSEGGLRVSQGTANYLSQPDNKQKQYLIKGSMGSVAQYTQETQLNPEFASKLAVASEGVPEVSDQEDIVFQEGNAEYEHALDDFEAQIKVSDFDNSALAYLLHEIPAGMLSKEYFSELFANGGDIERYTAQLNHALANSNVIPDFSKEPSRVEQGDHYQLGPINYDVYDKNGVEWYMAVANDVVWIDRIRIKDSEATAYGTDKNMIYSGLLTSKPIDYKQQTTGLPDKYVEAMPSSRHYVKIDKFLATLEPIKRYKSIVAVSNTNTFKVFTE